MSHPKARTRCHVPCRRFRSGLRRLSSLNASAARVSCAGPFFRFSIPTAICSRSTTASTKTLCMPRTSCGTRPRICARKVRMKDSAATFPDISVLDRIHGAVRILKVSSILRSAFGFGATRRDPPVDPAGATLPLEPRPLTGGPGTSVAMDDTSATSEFMMVALPAWLSPRRAGSSERESKAAPSRRARASIAARVRWRCCSLSRSTRRRTRDSGPARLPATARAAAGIARWRLCAPQPWGLRLPWLGGCFSMRFA